MKKPNTSPQPPRLAVWLLKRFFPDEAGFYTHLGDIDEAFNNVAREKSLFIAKAWYWMATLRSIPYSIGRSVAWSFIMIKNYLKIALRNIVRQKSYSFINILGLAVGIACCILIYVYVNYELSYDSYHPDVDRIYRTTMHFKIADADFFRASAPGPMAGALRRDYPEVSKASQVVVYNRILIEVEGNYFEDSRLLYVEDDFFDIWSIDFIKGEPRRIKGRPYALALTEGMVRKYFGSANPLGKIVRVNRIEFEITGVIKDPPSNTHLKYNFLTETIV